MRIQPRQQLADIWRHIAQVSWADGEWKPGGRAGNNSISDAEQLLCIMGPATELDEFQLVDLDEVGADLTKALEPLGINFLVPQRLVRALSAYLDRYTAEDGTPVFSGGTAFWSAEVIVDHDQRAMDVVDSFAVSVTLTLATIGFSRSLREKIGRPTIQREAEELERRASDRLSAALVGLLRSFSLNVFPANGSMGRELIRSLNQEHRAPDAVVKEFRMVTTEVRTRLRDDVTIGSGAASIDELDLPNGLFECGWSWGLVRDAPKIQTAAPVGVQRDGVAENKPYLYFTTVVLDALEALGPAHIGVRGLLNEEQARLAGLLQTRIELTRAYWSAVATFGAGRWPLEDLPWQTTDGLYTDYYSLLVTGLLLHDMATRRPPRAEIARVAAILEDLANRSRITRRAAPGESAVKVHHPGIAFPLVGSDQRGGALLSWIFTDMAPQLLQCTLKLARISDHSAENQRMLDLSDQIWAHLKERAATDGSWVGLWDQPAAAFPHLRVRYKQVSWYYTRRVVDCLITVAKILDGPPVHDEQLTQLASALLRATWHLYGRERLQGKAFPGVLDPELEQIHAALERAQSAHIDSPSIAVAFLVDAIKALDRRDAGRRAAGGTAARNRRSRF
jgi:hypothetical protein